MKDFGAHLKHAREDAGLTLQDIHESTRISIKNLRLIESGDFPSIPQTYVRAFVREYALAVGLDADDTLAYYNEAAEAEKGIPRPPENIDSSNLRIEVDDTIEYIEPLDRPPSHVEVEGKAEVEEDDYVPPVRKSRYVDENAGEAIDIRTSGERAEALSPPARKENRKQDDTPSSPESREDSEDVFSEGPHRKEHAPSSTPPADREKERSSDAPAESTREESADRKTAEQKPAAQEPVEQKPAEQKKTGTTPVEEKTSAEETPAQKTAAEAPTAKHNRPERSEKSKRKPTPVASGASAASSKTAASAKPATSGADSGEKKSSTGSPAPPPSDAQNEKRIIGVGMVIIAMLAIAVYGIFYFSADDETETALADSTAIKASIEAGRFIDSSQYALTELDMNAEDTVSTEPLEPPEPVESKPRVFEKADSLVLEAFTSAPVWFSVKMDTLRTERGSLSSKEHRVWKARDYFVITLGDAGAVTFFLNGKEIGTLGEEGAVVKNVTLSRRQLEGK